MPKPESYLALERTMAQGMLAGFNLHVLPILRSIRNAVAAGDFPKAYALVDTLGFPPTTDAQRGRMELTGLHAVVLGAKTITPEGAISFSQGGVPDAVPISIDNMFTSLQRRVEPMQARAKSLVARYDRQVNHLTDASTLVAKIEDIDAVTGLALGTTVRPAEFFDDIDEFAAQMNRATLLGGKRAVDIEANVTSSRLRSYGFLIEAETTGTVYYQISAQLDERTCHFCENVHGRTFEATAALAVVTRAVNTTNPADLTQISPWPKQTKDDIARLYEMTDRQVQASGFDTPPFHPSCRCIMMRDGTVTTDERRVPNFSPAAQAQQMAGVGRVGARALRAGKPKGGPKLPPLSNAFNEAVNAEAINTFLARTKNKKVTMRHAPEFMERKWGAQQIGDTASYDELYTRSWGKSPKTGAQLGEHLTDHVTNEFKDWAPFSPDLDRYLKANPVSIDPMFPANAQTLTSATAIEQYSSVWYTSTNRVLRVANKYGISIEDAMEHADLANYTKTLNMKTHTSSLIKVLDDFTTRHVVKSDTIVYRGIEQFNIGGPTIGETIFGVEAPIPGTVFKTPGFGSWSASPSTVTGFSEAASFNKWLDPSVKRGFIMRTAIPKGMQVGVVPNPYESELLLKRGLSWRVKAVHKNSFTGAQLVNVGGNAANPTGPWKMFVDKGDDYWHSRGIPKATYNEAVAAGRFEGWVDMYEDIIDLELITTPGNVVESGRATSTWAFPSFDFLDNVVPPLAWDDLPEYLRAKGQAVINNKVTSLYGGVLQPEAYRSLDELFAAARVAKADLDKMVVQIADRTSGKGLVAPLKKQARAAQKVAGKYGGDMRQLNDVARASIMYDSVDDLYEGLQRIGKEKGVRIVNIKDSFANVRINPATGNPSAYHDVQLILMMPNEHRVELQLHVFKLWEAKEGMTLTHKLPNGTWQIGGVPAAQARVAGHTFYEEMRVILESGTKYSKEEMATLLRLDNQTLAVYMPPYRDALYGFASQIDDVATIPKPPVPVKIVPKKGSVKLSLIDDNHVPRLEVMSEVRGVVDDISYYSPDPRALGASVHDETITTVTNRVPLQVDGKDIGFIDLDIDVNLEAAGLRDDLSGLGLNYRDALASKEGVPNINPGTVRISGISVASEYDEIEVLQQALSELMEKPVIGTSAFDRAIYIPTDSVSPTLRRYLQAAIGQVEGPSVRKSTGVVYSASQKKFLFPGYAVRPDYRHSLPPGKGPRRPLGGSIHEYKNLDDAKGHTIKEYLDDMDLNRQLVHGDDAYIRADEYVDGLGELTRKQYVDQADTVLSDVIAEADVFIRVDKDVARSVLVDGEVLNQTASGASHGLFNPRARNTLEELMYGIPQNDESFKRPVYGYLARNADGVGALNREILSDLNLKSSVTAPTFTDVSDMGTSGYGHVAYKLKPVKRANTTFTVGDSLDGIGDIVRHNTGLVDDELAAAGGLTSTNTQKILTGFMADIDDPARNVGRNLSTPSSPVPSYVNDPKRWSMGYGPGGTPRGTGGLEDPAALFTGKKVGDSRLMAGYDSGVASVNSVNGVSLAPYVEAQIHGGVVLDDIQEAIIYVKDFTGAGADTQPYKLFAASEARNAGTWEKGLYLTDFANGSIDTLRDLSLAQSYIDEGIDVTFRYGHGGRISIPGNKIAFETKEVFSHKIIRGVQADIRAATSQVDDVLTPVISKYEKQISRALAPAREAGETRVLAEFDGAVLNAGDIEKRLKEIGDALGVNKGIGEDIADLTALGEGARPVIGRGADGGVVGLQSRTALSRFLKGSDGVSRILAANNGLQGSIYRTDEARDWLFAYAMVGDEALVKTFPKRWKDAVDLGGVSSGGVRAKLKSTLGPQYEVLDEWFRDYLATSNSRSALARYVDDATDAMTTLSLRDDAAALSRWRGVQAVNESLKSNLTHAALIRTEHIWKARGAGWVEMGSAENVVDMASRVGAQGRRATVGFDGKSFLGRESFVAGPKGQLTDIPATAHNRPRIRGLTSPYNDGVTEAYEEAMDILEGGHLLSDPRLRGRMNLQDVMNLGGSEDLMREAIATVGGEPSALLWNLPGPRKAMPNILKKRFLFDDVVETKGGYLAGTKRVTTQTKLMKHHRTLMYEDLYADTVTDALNVTKDSVDEVMAATAERGNVFVSKLDAYYVPTVTNPEFAKELDSLLIPWDNATGTRSLGKVVALTGEQGRELLNSNIGAMRWSGEHAQFITPRETLRKAMSKALRNTDAASLQISLPTRRALGVDAVLPRPVTAKLTTGVKTPPTVGSLNPITGIDDGSAVVFSKVTPLVEGTPEGLRILDGLEAHQSIIHAPRWPRPTPLSGTSGGWWDEYSRYSKAQAVGEPTDFLKVQKKTMDGFNWSTIDNHITASDIDRPAVSKVKIAPAPKGHKRLYNASTVDWDVDDYLEPHVSDWVKEVAGGAGDVPVEDITAPLVFMAEEPGDWMTSIVSRKLGKPNKAVTLEDIRDHGRLNIIDADIDDAIYKVGDFSETGEVIDLTGSRLKFHETALYSEGDVYSGAGALTDMPVGPEPHDFITGNVMDVKASLTGDDLIVFLRSEGVDLPDGVVAAPSSAAPPKVFIPDSSTRKGISGKAYMLDNPEKYASGRGAKDLAIYDDIRLPADGDLLVAQHTTSEKWITTFLDEGVDGTIPPPDRNLGKLTITESGVTVNTKIDTPGLYVTHSSDITSKPRVVIVTRADEVISSVESIGAGRKTGYGALYNGDALLNKHIPASDIAGKVLYSDAQWKATGQGWSYTPNPKSPYGKMFQLNARNEVVLAPAPVPAPVPAPALAPAKIDKFFLRTADDAIVVREEIEAIEDAWYGTPASFGERYPARALSDDVPGYTAYRKELQTAAREELGEEFTVYRLWDKNHFEAWKGGEDIGPLSTTLSKKRAESFRKMPANKGKDLVVTEIRATPDAMVMRGIEGELEVVLDFNELSFADSMKGMGPLSDIAPTPAPALGSARLKYLDDTLPFFLDNASETLRDTNKVLRELAEGGLPRGAPIPTTVNVADDIVAAASGKPGATSQVFADNVDMLDFLTQTTTLKEDVFLYRSVSPSVVEKTFGKSLSIGQVAGNDGFIQWSATSSAPARKAMRHKPERRTVLRIRAAKGTKGFYYGGENKQFILPRGTTYRLSNVEENVLVGYHPTKGGKMNLSRPIYSRVVTVESIAKVDGAVVAPAKTVTHRVPRGSSLTAMDEFARSTDIESVNVFTDTTSSVGVHSVVVQNDITNLSTGASNVYSKSMAAGISDQLTDEAYKAARNDTRLLQSYAGAKRELITDKYMQKVTDVQQKLDAVFTSPTTSNYLPDRVYTYAAIQEGQDKAWKGMQVGDAYSSPGYTSSTLGPHTVLESAGIEASTFESGKYVKRTIAGVPYSVVKVPAATQPTIVRYVLPEGQRALTSYDNLNVMLPRNTTFRVLGKELDVPVYQWTDDVGELRTVTGRVITVEPISLKNMAPTGAVKGAATIPLKLVPPPQMLPTIPVSPTSKLGKKASKLASQVPKAGKAKGRVRGYGGLSSERYMHPINDPLNQSATKAASKIGADLEIKYTLVEEAGSSGPASFRPVLEQTGRKVKTTGGRRLSKFEPAEQTYLATLDDARDIPVSLHLDDVMPVGRLGGGEGFESFIEKEFQERIDTPWAHRGRTTEKIKGARGSISKVDEVFRGTLSADALTEAELSMHAGAKTVFDNVPTLPQELVVYRAMRASELLEEGARDVAGAVGRAYANPAPTYLTTDIRRASRHAASMRKATPDAEVVLVQLRLEEGAKVLYMGDGNVVASPGTVFQLDELLPKVNTFESTLANSTKPAGSFGSFQEANLLRYKRSLLDPATPFSDDVFTASAFARPDEGMWDFPVLSGRQVPTTQSVNTSARLGKGTKLGIEWADHSFGAPIRGASTSVSDIIVMPSIREPVRNVTAEASTFDDGIKHFYRKYRDETDVNSWLREVPSVDTSSDIYGLGQVSTADDFISSHSLIDRDEIEAVRSWYTAKENSSEALSVYMHGMADGKNATLIDDVARGIEKPGLGALELQAREKWIPALDELIETSEGAFPRPYSRTAGRSAVDDVWPATYGGSASKGTMGVGDVHINRTYMHTTVHPHKAVLDAIENKTPTLTKDGTRAVYEDVTLTRVYIKKGDKVIQVGSQEAEEFLHGRGAAFHVTEVESNAILMEVSNIQSKTEGIDTAAWFPTLDPKRAAKVDTVFVRGDIITLESVAPQQVEAAAEIGARRGGVIVPVDTGGYIAADNSYSAAWKTALRERKEAGVYDGRYAIEDIVTDTYKDSYAGNGLTSQYASRPLDKAAAAKYVEGPQSFVPNKVKFDHEAAVKRARAADAGKKLPKKAVGHYTGIGSGEMNEISRLLDEAERLPSSRRMIRESGAWDPDVGLAETLYPKGGKFDTYAANRIIKAFNDGTLNFKWGDAEWAPRGQKLDGWLRMGLTARAGSGTTLRMQLSLQQALKYKSSPLPEDVILMRGIKGAHPGRMGGFKEGELFTNWTTGSWTGDPNLASSFGRLGGRTVDDIDDLLNLGKVTSDGSRVYSPAIVAAKKERGIMLRVKYPKGAPYTTAPDFFEEEFILGPSTFRIKKATYRGHGEASFHDVNWELRGESKALLPENAKAFADGQWGKLGLADDEIAELDQLQNFRDWLTKASQLPDDDILWVTTPYTRSDFVETLDALTDSAKYRAAVEEAAGAGREFLEGMASRAKLAGTIRPFQPPLTRWPVLSQIQVGEGSVHSGRHRVRVTIPYESIPARVLDLEYVPTAAAAEAIAPVQTQAALAEAAVKLVDDADVTFKRIARVTDEDFLPKTWLSDVDPDDARSVFTDTDIGARKIFVTEVKPADVAAHIKNGGSMHVSDSRKVGALVTDKGTVGNLFNSNGPGAGREMLLDLIENGDAKTLDCFDGFLPEYYKQFGFVEYKRVKWNDAYAPKKWDYGKHGRPDIVYMKYAGGNRATVRQRFIAGQSLTSDAQSAFERGAAISHQAEIRASFKGGAGGEMAKRKSLAAGRAVERNDKSRLILNQLAEPTDKRSPAWAIRFGDEGNEFWLGTSDVGPDLRRATTDRAAVANTVETLTTVQGFNSVDEVIEWAVSRGAKRESVTAVSRSLEAKYSRARLIDPSLRSGASAEVLVQEAKRAAKAVKKKDAQRVFLDLLERPDITRNIDGVTSRHRLSKTVRKQLFLDSVDDMTELHRSESFLPDIVTKPYSVVEVELPTPVARATGTVFDSSTLVITPPSNVAKKVIPVIKPTPGSSQIDDTASAFYGKGSGEKVTFRYVRNPEPAPNFGSLYGQDVEPAGMYVNEATSGHVPPGYDSGTLTFKSPLYIEATGAYQDKSSWKHVLSSRYRTTADSVGTTLSRRIVQDGYDGVVVIEPATAKRGSYVSEIVDLRSFVTKSEALLEDVLQNSRYLHGVGGASLS